MEGCVLKYGDCHQLVKGIPDESVELIYTDPPFEITGTDWDSKLEWGELWPEFWRILKPGGNVVIHTSGKFTFEVALSQKRYLRYRWFWCKTSGNQEKTTGFPLLCHTNHQQSGTEPLRCVEEILVFNKKRRSSIYNPQPPQIGMGNMPNHCLFYTPRAGTFTRPLELVSFLVATYSNIGDTVLDICMSDGMTGTACLLSGRNFIGFDNYLPHFQLAEQNLRLKKTRNVEMSWLEDSNQFQLRWMCEGKKQSRLIAVPDVREKESIELRVKQLQDMLEVDPSMKPKLPRVTNKLGLRDIHPCISATGALQLKVALGNYKDGKNHTRKRTKTITVQDGLEQCALAQAVQKHASFHKVPRQVYDEEKTVRGLLEYKRQRIE